MKVRLNTMNVPLFHDGALHLTPAFTELDLDTLDPATLDAIELHVGRIIGVHPDDRVAFLQFTGLDVNNGCLVPFADDKGPPVGQRHQFREGPTVTRDPELRKMPVAAAPAATKPPVAEPSKADLYPSDSSKAEFYPTPISSPKPPVKR